MRITLIPLLLFLLTACTPAPTETPTPTPNGESTAIQANPTGTPAPSQTPAPTGIPPTISGASPGADGIGDPYFPDMGNGGYDVEKYTLEISVDPVSRSIDAVAALDILALHSLSSFNLDFDGPAIQSIHIDGEPAGYERRAGELIVTPHRPIAEGARFLVEITYAGDPSADASGGVTARESSWVWYPGGSFVAGEPTGAAGWYPVNEHPADKAVYEFLITVPAPYSVAANGELINTQVETGAATYHWIAEDPMAPYLVTVNVARFDLVEEITDSGVRIRNYFTTAVPESTRRQFDEQIEMLEFFEEIFGPYPFEMYGVVVHDLSLGFALETQTLSFFGSSFVNETVISHELAHQWFGDSVSLYRWEDIWLNEGFATYASLLWSEEKYGIFTLDREIERMYAAMAPGLPVYQTSRSGLVDGLGGLPYAGIEISRQQAGDALFALLENAVLRPEIDLVLEGYPENFDRSLILEVLDALPFSTASVTAAQVDSYLIILGLGDYSNGSLAYPPPGAPGPDRLFSGTVYQRGALTLHALRLAVGNTDFFEILKVYAERFANSNATTADFIAIAEEVSGEKLGELFDGWLYQVEIPDIPEMELFRADYLP